MNAANAMLCWDPDSDRVALVEWPDASRKSDSYEMTGLACYTAIRDMDHERRKAVVFIEAMHLIVRDKVDPMALHRALLGLDEYRDGMAPDMPIVNGRDE